MKKINLFTLFLFLSLFQSVNVQAETIGTTAIVDKSGVYSYSEMVNDITNLQKRYSFLKVESIGKTAENRNIYKVTLGTGKRKIMVNGAHHGREWITSLLVMNMLEEYSIAYEKNSTLNGYAVKDLLNQVSISFIPMVNPDGVQIAEYGFTMKQRLYFQRLHKRILPTATWKADSLGIDPNSNYNYKWAPNPLYPKPGVMGYRGTRYEQAKETIAIANDARKSGYDFHIAYHSSGEMLFWYAGQTGNQLSRDSRYVKLFSQQTGYRIIPSNSSQNTPAGMTDYVVSKLKLPALTIEVANGTYAGRQVSMKEYPHIWKDNRNIGLYTANLIYLEKRPQTPLVNKITNVDEVISGVAFKNQTVFIQDAKGTLISTGKTDLNGNFSIHILPQETNTELFIYVEDDVGLKSLSISMLVSEYQVK